MAGCAIEKHDADQYRLGYAAAAAARRTGRTPPPAAAFIAGMEQEHSMEIVRLPLGEQAPVDADCLRIEEQPGGQYKLTASALCVGTDDGASVSIVGGPIYATPDEAEAAGIAWADGVGVDRLFVTTGTLERPLETLEMD